MGFVLVNALRLPLHGFPIQGKLTSNLMSESNEIIHSLHLPYLLVTKTIEEGAQRIVFAALSQQIEDLSGNYLEDSKVVKPAAAACNRNNREMLWQKSCQLLNISNFGGLN